jgi:hypothetical protein
MEMGEGERKKVIDYGENRRNEKENTARKVTGHGSEK